jgi:hypothetical protein
MMKHRIARLSLGALVSLLSVCVVGCVFYFGGVLRGVAAEHQTEPMPPM